MRSRSLGAAAGARVCGHCRLPHAALAVGPAVGDVGGAFWRPRAARSPEWSNRPKRHGQSRRLPATVLPGEGLPRPAPQIKCES